MSQLPIRIIFGKEIIRLAEEYGYYAVCADTKCCSFEDFGDIYPERQISIGIAEQNLIGVASGLASCGHKVVLATYSVFATMRACEQLRTVYLPSQTGCYSHGDSCRAADWLGRRQPYSH